ncbi:MAG: ribosome maturation factor RimM [Halieaceae bacterium]|nr:ribosome maturation factor RimM [Halieaceae bacterium]
MSAGTADELTDLLVVAEVVGAYGIKGWVKLRSYTEVAEDLFKLEGCRIRPPGASKKQDWQALAFRQGKRHGKGLIGQIVGVDTRDAAEALRGSEIGLPREALPALAPGEYYWHQLQGLVVECGEFCLGRVESLMETGANDVLVVEPAGICSAAIEARQRLIPWVWGDVVKQVDLDAGVVRVEWDPEF